MIYIAVLIYSTHHSKLQKVTICGRRAIFPVTGPIDKGKVKVKRGFV